MFDVMRINMPIFSMWLSITMKRIRLKKSLVEKATRKKTKCCFFICDCDCNMYLCLVSSRIRRVVGLPFYSRSLFVLSLCSIKKNKRCECSQCKETCRAIETRCQEENVTHSTDNRIRNNEQKKIGKKKFWKSEHLNAMLFSRRHDRCADISAAKKIIGIAKFKGGLLMKITSYILWFCAVHENHSVIWQRFVM